MSQSLALSQYESARRAVESDAASPQEKAEMLMETAIGMQVRPVLKVITRPDNLQKGIEEE